MKIFYLSLLFLSSCFTLSAQNVTIIESQSQQAVDVEDSVWQAIATQAGMNAIIFPQTKLNDTLFFPTTDILIISSGTKALPAFRLANINKFLKQGGKIYLQGEWDPTYDTDQGFQSIVDSLGSNFTWNSNYNTGILAPMNVFGTLANTPNIVSTLDYVWWGVPGGGCGQIEPFLEYQGNYYGFIFCDTLSGGRIITASDMDWVLQSVDAPSLIRNILFNLTNSFNCPSNGVHVELGNDTIVNFPYTLDAGNPGSHYLWSTGDTTKTVILNSSGNYWVQVTNASGCVDADTIQMLAVGENILSVEKFSLTISSTADGLQCTIDWNKKSDALLEIISADGRVAYSAKINLLEKKNVIDVHTKFSQGIYLVRTIADEKSWSRKFFVQ